MDSLGRRSGRQMARMRRQRSQEWREREFSSSDNEEGGNSATSGGDKKYRYVVDDRPMHYDKDVVKAGLDPRAVNAVIPMDNRGRSGHPASVGGGVGGGIIQTVENKTYAPLSGSDGDTETDNGHSPIAMLLQQQQQSPHLNLPGPGGRGGRMSMPLQRGPSTSSSDNNSDTTFADSDMAMMRANAIACRNDSTDSPPEPAPPEVPPRGISMHHADLASLRGPRDILTLSNASRSLYSGVNSSPPPQGLASNKDIQVEHNLKSVPSDSPRGNSNQQQHQTVSALNNNNTQLNNLLPAIMPIHPVRSGNSNSVVGLPHHSSQQPPQHYVVPTAHGSGANGSGSRFSPTNFQIRKSCSHRCSWKCLAIFLIFVTVLLTSALAYFGTVSTMTLHLESSTGCILVEDAQLASIAGVETTPSPSLKVPTPYPTRVAPNDHDLWPVVEIPFAQKTAHEIQPHGFWNVQIRQTQASFVRFNLSVAAWADLALYARRHMPPTITQYDFTEVIRKHSNADGKKARAASVLAEVSFLHHLDPGWWFVSIYNDNNDRQVVNFATELAIDVSTRCPQNCHNHGACTLGKCECYQGYTGLHCEHSLCPVLCSNHGTYSGGVCHCEKGWKGAECNVPELDCEVADCNSHGECRAGVCMCSAGFKGRHCENVDCVDPGCSEHGMCAQGRCICRPGWSGSNCSRVDDRLVQCLPNCSGHGTFDLDTGHCLCERYWTGLECTEAVCSADCGPFGKCIGEQCQCLDGWTGAKCDHKLCDVRCAEHGQCNNGTCVCMQGWNGKHCTLEGCSKDCNHHGNCIMSDGDYQCQCHDDWDGRDCGVQLERACNDKIDNDNDGLVDCEDSECCSSTPCLEHLMCVTTADPVDVLYRKQPPAVTASFYQRMKFLIEENSVQSYVHKDEYSENKFWTAFIKSRVAVIRGRVVNTLGQGLIGIRVSVETEPNFGFTLTRDQGWFDIMVNGGGAVTLRFHRGPFRPTTSTLMVPWNQIVVMDKEAVMRRDDEPPSTDDDDDSDDGGNGVGSAGEETSECSITASDRGPELRPVIYETWKPDVMGGCPDRRVIYTETQVVQEILDIPGSDLHLLYQSSSSPGYYGTLHIQLTPARPPPALAVVLLRVIVEGIEFEKRFEADPNVTFTFAWNKRNVYKQKVYGIAIAKVSVGYQYTTCPKVVWTTQTAKLQGYDMDISEIGGWNLDLHHRYNFQDGTLQKGDGTTVYFSGQPNVVQVVMGNGEQRPLSCDDCNGLAKDAKLLAPVALTSGPDGSLYVGDFNLVRRITPKGHVQTLITLSATQMSYHYHLAVHPVDGSLYMSSPEKGQIVKVISEDETGEDATVLHVEVVVGSGERCVVGDHRACGDGGQARHAKLAYPKGMTISSDGVLYFADGANVRMVDKAGLIHTIIGSHHHHRKHRKPLPCVGATPAKEVQLLWPTEMALSPLDGGLYFIDDNLILKLSEDLRQVTVVTGHPLHCHDDITAAVAANIPSSSSGSSTSARGHPLGSVLGLAFAPNGNLLFAEVTAKKVNYVHAVTPDGRLEHFAGAMARCECAATAATAQSGPGTTPPSNCTCPDPKYSLAVNTQLFAVSALAATPDGAVYVADHGSLRLLAITSYLPRANALGDYEIAFPDAQELYVFNRHGQHTATRSLLTGRTVYAFLYSVNTSFGKLSTVTDASGNKVSFLRDYSGKINTIENAQGQKYRIKISKVGLMEGLVTFSNFEVALEYHGGSGLLGGRSDSAGNTFVYTYDDNGRLREAVTPTGRTTTLATRMRAEGAEVTVTRGQDDPYSLVVTASSSVITRQDSSWTELTTFANGSSSLRTPWGYRSDIRTAPHVGLEISNPIQAEMFFTPVAWQTASGRSISTVDWKYGIMGDARAADRLVERQLWVNGTGVLSIEYDQAMLREVIYDKDHYSVFAVQYDSAGKPVQWVPSIGGLPVNIMYDRFGRLFSWQWGKMGEEFTYDHQGLLTEIKYDDGTAFRYTYAENSLPVKLTLPSGREFQLHYDHQGSLKYVTTPNGGQHHFSVQLSLGFTKFLYAPPGFRTPLVRHYDDDGQLLAELQPNGAGRILYRYRGAGRLTSMVYGPTRVDYAYTDGGLLAEVHQKSTGADFDYRREMKYDGVLLTEERHKFGSRTGLANARFMYEYDSSYRLSSCRGRIGGQDVAAANMTYDGRTGRPRGLGHFRLSAPRPNETTLADGVATFNRSRDMYLREVQLTLTIDKAEVYKMEVGYDQRGRLSTVRIQQRKMGQVTNSDSKNYTYDLDGQLKEVHAHDTWRFEYDANGNMITLNFRGHNIPLQYDEMDRISKYSEMSFKVDGRGFITQRGEEHFYYDAKGHMTRATQTGRYDVWYHYDDDDRLVARKDHFGNVTQFFYAHPERRRQLTHIYSARDGRLLSLSYDERGHLVHARAAAQHYYVAADLSGTPLVMFNNYGEVVREMLRSPYGHIVYDSNPFVYMPIDYRGGILDSLTGLIHLGRRVYDPLIGHWMTPEWDGVLKLAVPKSFHLFRINGNDPVNPPDDRWFLTDHLSWLRHLGYDADSIVPQLNSRVRHRCLPARRSLFPVQESLQAVSGVGCIVRRREANLLQLATVAAGAQVKKEPVLHRPRPRVHTAQAPLGPGLLVSRVDRRAMVRSAPHDGAGGGDGGINRDVMTSVLNNSHFLDVRLTQQRHDVFFFVKENVWQVTADLNQLQRLGLAVNFTVHKSEDAGHGSDAQHVDVKIHTPGAVLGIRYGTSYEAERTRLLRHAKRHAVAQAWDREKQLLSAGHSGSRDWSPVEVEQILRDGVARDYTGEYVHGVEENPELADDPGNIAFHRAGASRHRRR